MRRRQVLLAGEELHMFANALRACLGLDPLYGDGDDPGAVEYRGVRIKKERQARAATAADAALADDYQPIAAE